MIERRDMDQAAADWVVRMTVAEWSDADEDALQGWLAADSRHKGALLQAQALWTTLEDYDEAIARDAMPKDRRVTRRWLVAGGGTAIAASLATAVLVSRGQHYSTAVGEIRRVPLSDGSIASINTDSALEVAMASSRREIKLTKGEAWFQVAKDPARPFVVATGRVRVQAVGTAFSVRRRDGGADILVTEGVVEAWADGAEGHVIRLGAGESAFVSDDAAIRPVDPKPGGVDRSLAWRSGKIDLASTPLEEAAAEFNRYNIRQIEIADRALAKESLDGVFGINDPTTFAMAVRNGLSVPVDLSDPQRIRIGIEPGG